MKAYTDASIPRKPYGIYPNYGNAFLAVFLPKTGEVITQKINSAIDPNDCLPLQNYIDMAELAAISLAIKLGALEIYSDSKNAIRMAEILYPEFAYEWIKGHESLDKASEKETLIRIPHVFAKKHEEKKWNIKISLPVQSQRGWIEIL